MDYQRLLEAEEKIVDLNELQAFRERLTATMPSQRMSNVQQKFTMESIMKDPSIVQEISTNPRGLLAISDLVDKGAAGIEKYKDEPKLYAVLQRLLDMN